MKGLLLLQLVFILWIASLETEGLVLSSQSQRRPRPKTSRAPLSGPSTAPTPPVQSNTRRRRRDSRSSSSPLVVFYGMFMDRFRPPNQEETTKTTTTTQGEELFTEDMRDKKQEFIQRYEHYRGRGRWGGYSLQGIAQNPPTAAPLPVVSSNNAKASPKKRVKLSKPLLQINDIEQYKQQVVDAKDADLVVVRFYAPWCKACKAMEGSFYRLQHEFPATVKFVEVPLTKENAYLHKGLGVSSLPFVHIYQNSGIVEEGRPACTLVEELKIGKSRFSNFKSTLRSYVQKECEVYYHDNGKLVTASSGIKIGDHERKVKTSVG